MATILLLGLIGAPVFVLTASTVTLWRGDSEWPILEALGAAAALTFLIGLAAAW